MADYPDIYPWIDDCLRSVGAEAVTADLDRNIKSELRPILSPSGTLYASLSGDDKDAIDEAAGLRTAARLWRSMSTDGLGGGLTTNKDDESSEGYVDPKEMLAEWERKATLALGPVSFLPAPGSGTTMFAVNGPRRYRQTLCPTTTPDYGCCE